MMRTVQPSLTTTPTETRTAKSRGGSTESQRRRSARAFGIVVFLLISLIIGLGYLAWFSPWARPIHTVKVDTIPATGRVGR